MTSEDVAASVVLPSVDGKVISSQSTGDENSKNTLDSSVIKRSRTVQDQENTETAVSITRLKGHHVDKSLLIASKEETRENINEGEDLLEKPCLSNAVDYFSINRKVLEKACKANLGFNQFCKSYNPLKGKNVCLEPQIPAVLTEINFKVDGSVVDRRALQGQLIVSDHCTDAVGCIPTLHLTYSTPKGSLCSTNNPCILGSHLQTMKRNCSGSFVSGSNHLNGHSQSCDSNDGRVGFCSEGGHPMTNQSMLCSEKAPVFAGDSAHGQDLLYVMSSNPLQSQETCESFMDEIDNDLSRSRKDRSTLLVRRFCKNYKEVKRSVYTGTSAILKSLPSGHIGTRACCFVERKQERANERTCPWITAQRLASVQGSTRRDLLCYLVRMTVCQVRSYYVICIII